MSVRKHTLERLWRAKFPNRSPSLGNLLNECVKLDKTGDIHLEAAYGEWSATKCILGTKKEDCPWYNGKSPEEALANLWLAVKTGQTSA